MQAGRQAEKAHTGTYTDRQADRQIHTDRYTQTDTDRYTQTDTHRHT